jgi:ribosomal protein L20
MMRVGKTPKNSCVVRGANKFADIAEAEESETSFVHRDRANRNGEFSSLWINFSSEGCLNRPINIEIEIGTKYDSEQTRIRI